MASNTASCKAEYKQLQCRLDAALYELEALKSKHEAAAAAAATAATAAAANNAEVEKSSIL
jgi:hypothetical protein